MQQKLAQFRTSKQGGGQAPAAVEAPDPVPSDPIVSSAMSDLQAYRSKKDANGGVPPVRQEETAPDDGIKGGFFGRLFTGATQKFGKTAGEAFAAPENADLYSDSLKQHTDIQNNLLKAIAKKKELGQDTTRLQEALDRHVTDTPKLTDFTGDVIDKTTGQVLGEAAGTGLEALSGGALSSGAEIAGAKALSTGQKVAKGAKLGAIYGGIGGGANSAAEGGDVADIAGGAVGGAAIGAVTGGALEGIVSKIPKPGILKTAPEKEMVTFEKKLRNAEESIYPKLTAAEKKTVKMKDQNSLFGPKSVPDLQSTPQTKPIIESVANLPEDIQVKPSDTIVQKESKLQQGITRKHQETAEMLSRPETKAETVFDPQKYDNFMKNKVLDPIAEEYGVDSLQYKNAQKGVGISKTAISENNAYGVHEGRQAFDRDFKARNKNAFKQQNSLFGQLDPHVTSIVQTGQDIRTAMNDFAESLLPENHPFRPNLKQESNLLRALSEMRKRNAGDIGKNSLQRTLDRNPNTKRAVKTLAQMAKMGTALDIMHGL